MKSPAPHGSASDGGGGSVGVGFAIPSDTASAVIAQLREGGQVERGWLGVSIQPDTPRHLPGDPTRLTQILLNLLGNAVKFTDSGRVTVTVTPVEDRPGAHRIRFEVADTGPGIPLERQAELFKPFEQLSPSRARRFGGSGLGLSICKGLVEAMHGSIGVESGPGIGSRFWFEVELLAGSRAVAPTPSGDGATPPRGRGGVVVGEHRVHPERVVAPQLVDRRCVGARARIGLVAEGVDVHLQAGGVGVGEPSDPL